MDFIMDFFSNNLSKCSVFPQWNLPIVLTAPSSKLFKPTGQTRLRSLSIKKGFMLPLTSTQRVNNLCTVLVHLNCSESEWYYSRTKLILPKNTETWMEQLCALWEEKKKKEIICSLCRIWHAVWNTQPQNPAQTGACQLAVWRCLTSLWVDRPSSGDSCALRKESGSLVWWNIWG